MLITFICFSWVHEVFNQVELEEVDVPILLPHEVLHAIAMAGPEQVGMGTRACVVSTFLQKKSIFKHVS